MQTPTRLLGLYRGRHHLPVLATFRPTWPQALSDGLGVPVRALLALASTGAVAALWVDPVGGVVAGVRRLPGVAWLAVLAYVMVSVLGGAAVRRRGGVRVDGAGLHGLPPARDGFAPWTMVTDVRAERRGRRTVIVLHFTDESIRRLRAPYDGGLLGRDPQFERKLFLIRHLWEVHGSARAAS